MMMMMRWRLCALILLAASARAAFIPPAVDSTATPADVHFDSEGNLVIGATGVITTAEVYPDREGGYYASYLHMTQYIAIDPSGIAHWYYRSWTTYGRLDRPPPPDAISEPEPAEWRESSSNILDFVNFTTGLKESFGETLLTNFMINLLSGPGIGYDLIQHLQAHAPCARHALDSYSLLPYFHIMMWREASRAYGVDIWDLDLNQSGIPWWRNRAVLGNADWNGDGALNRVEIEIGRDPAAPAYVQSLVPDDDGNLISVPDHFAWDACAERVVADAGPDQEVEAGAGGFADVLLNGALSSSTVPGPLTYTWDVQPSAASIPDGISPVVTLPLGSYAVILTVTDSGGNTATDTLLVAVRDTTLPIFSSLPGDTVLEQATPQGTAYSLPQPTAWDLASGFVAVSNDAPAVFPPGATLVTFSAADASGNTAMATAVVTVVDTTPPVIGNVPEPITTTESDPAGTPVPFPWPTASDAADPAPSLSSDAPALFPLGTTLVTFTGRDQAGNTSTASTTVTIVQAAGFDASLDAALLCPLESATLSILPRGGASAQTLSIVYDNHITLRNGKDALPSGGTISLSGPVNLTVIGALPGSARIVIASGSTMRTLDLEVTSIAAVIGTGSAGQSASSAAGAPLVLALNGSGASVALSLAWSHGSRGALARYEVRGPRRASGGFDNDNATLGFTRAGTYTVSVWADGNGDGSADAAELPCSLNVLVVDLNVLLALDLRGFHIVLDPGLTEMQAKASHRGGIDLLLVAGISPSSARNYVRWTLSAGGKTLDSGDFRSPVQRASATASVGSTLRIDAWVDCNGNGVQDSGESGRAITVKVIR